MNQLLMALQQRAAQMGLSMDQFVELLRRQTGVAPNPALQATQGEVQQGVRPAQIDRAVEQAVNPGAAPAGGAIPPAGGQGFFNGPPGGKPQLTPQQAEEIRRRLQLMQQRMR